MLTAIPFLSERMDLKKHFSLTYLNFGVHILMIAILSGLMSLDENLIFFPLLCVAVGFYLWYARTRGSLYFLTVAVFYGYIGLTYVILISSDDMNWASIFYPMYFVASCAGVIFFLTQYKRFIKK